MSDYLHERINNLENRIKRFTNNPAPTIPIYDVIPIPGGGGGGGVGPAGLCAGNIHAIASSGTSQSGLSLVLTVSRDLVCDSIIHVFTAAHSAGSAFLGAPIPDTCIDSRGNSYASTSTNGAIGQANDDAIPLHTHGLGISRSFLATVPAGGLSTGDTITLTFDPGWDVPCDLIGLAFAFVHMGNAVSQLTFGGHGIHVDNGDSYPTEPSNISWISDYSDSPSPDVNAAFIGATCSYPTSSLVPLHGSVLDSISDVLSLVVYFDPLVTAGTSIDPGVTWGTVDVSCANYQFCAIT